jgi:outer membrane protein assembly factor BamB
VGETRSQAATTDVVELPPGGWEPPPVRRGGGAASPPPERRNTTLEVEAAARAKKRRNTGLMLGVAGFALVGLLGGLGFLWYYVAQAEDREREAAEKSYAGGLFDEASGRYGKLAEKFPDSPRRDEYQFLQDLSGVRALPTRSDRKGAFDRVSAFLKDRKDHPLFNDHGKEVGEALIALLDDAAKSAVTNVGDPEAQADFQRGRAVLDELRALNRDWAPAEKIAEIDKKREEIDRLAQQEKERQDLIARLKALAAKPFAEAIRTMHAILREEAAKPTRFDQNADVKAVENELKEKHRDSVTFTDTPEPAAARGPAEDVLPGLVVHPVVAPPADGPKLSSGRVVFALVRGVLYGLRQSDGATLWAMRVGIDTAHLPLRVPPAGNTPELALVLSADTLTLTAVNAYTNETLWKHRLGSASLGRPVLVDRRVYVPTLGGEVQEIEVAGGKLIGRYQLGQSLSVGGARFGDTKQIYFPGDASCVYVLDVGKHTCQAILYTDHAAGSLRGEPILMPSPQPDDDPTLPGYLVLSQAHGLDATLLRTFRLLPPDPNAAPGAQDSRLRVGPEPMPERRLRGWPWFPPYRDPEKLVTVTDAGVLGLFGIVQAHNKDDALFPLVRVPGNEDGTVELTGHGAARGRAQVVFARDNDLWVLARGRLLRYVLALDQTGPRLSPDLSWKQPLDLGSPLHESQTDDDGRTLFLVTQAPNGQACLATAVDAETGRLRWQRQLGLVCHGDPYPLGEEVVALDQGGGLFRFEPRRHPADLDAMWQTGGSSLEGPLPDGAAGSVALVPGPDGQSLYQFACPEPGTRLFVREYRAGVGKASSYQIELPARLAGTPAVGDKRLLLPLANKEVRQVRLPLGPTSVAVVGPSWRTGPAEGQGHIVWLGGEDFLATNARRGLTRWRFGDDDTYAAVPPGKSPTLELPEPVAGAPVVLSRAGGGAPLRVCAADDRGTVYLFEGDELKPVRHWDLKEPLTAGPFVRGDRVGCVVGRRRLVWLDPAKDKEQWTYPSPGEGIVGQPQIADGLVLVADISGRFVALDPANGKPRGPGYQLRASVGPAAAPVGFGPGRAFAPLTDGTVLLLPLRPFREPLPGLPPVW